MKTFTISRRDLNDWFAARSPDCLHLPEYGYGDFGDCSAGDFMRAASNWGLRQIGCPSGFDGYRFAIVDESTFFGSGAASGMHQYGTVEGSESEVESA